MAKSSNVPLDPELISLAAKRGEASPSPTLVPSAPIPPPPVRPEDESLFAAKTPSEPRSGITIRIKVSAAARLDNLSRRTGRTKQELLDRAIADLLDSADQQGNLTAPL